MVGLLDDGVPVAGWIHQPYIGETFAAVGGAATFTHGGQRSPMRTRADSTLETAVFYTTFPGWFRPGRQLDALERISAASKLVRYSDNGSTLSAVNFPEVTLPEHVGGHRLLHIHRNVPGVLSRINEIFGQRGINIDGQFLRTDPNVGYVVIDVSADDAQATELRAALAAIPGTLRTRVLY